jgi:hypothetical protein
VLDAPRWVLLEAAENGALQLGWYVSCEFTERPRLLPENRRQCGDLGVAAELLTPREDFILLAANAIYVAPRV